MCTGNGMVTEKWNEYRKLEQVIDVRIISGCGKGYRILAWVPNMSVIKGFVNRYRRFE